MASIAYGCRYTRVLNGKIYPGSFHAFFLAMQDAIDWAEARKGEVTFYRVEQCTIEVSR